MDEILDNLNDDQIKPVMDTEGHVLVLAGAGSGKTRVLTSRIAYILREGLCAPSSVLAITFTNKAAGEMRDRLGTVSGGGGMWVCTIHSMCARILRQFGSSVGLDANFSIYSDTEKTNTLKRIIKGNSDFDERLLKGAIACISAAKSAGLGPDEYYEENRMSPDILAVTEIYRIYDETLRRDNAADFDDLLMRTLELLRTDTEALDFLSDRFRYILVDEFQDTNAVQYEIIKLLAGKHGNLFAVGDDDQSIYGWRGAEIRNILSFDTDFPDAKVYKLQRNYRSTGAILDLANRIIANNGDRREKKLWTDREKGEEPVYFEAGEESSEAAYAADIISAAVEKGAAYSDFAVLMRINALTRPYEQEFSRRGIPYKVFGGFRFFERKEIKDMLAYMRLISNPFDDEAFMRIVNVPRRGIGERSLAALSARAAEEDTNLFYAALESGSMDIPARAKNSLYAFASFIKEMVVLSGSVTADVLAERIVAETGLRSFYDDRTDEGFEKAKNIDEYIASVSEFVENNPGATLTDYLGQVTLSSDTDNIQDGDFVTVATIHSVKGLEFGQVIICGLEDGIMPTSRAEREGNTEEERRLMYVAVTRAKDRLYLTRSKTRFLYGSRSATVPSMFLWEGGYARGSGRVYGGRGREDAWYDQDIYPDGDYDTRRRRNGSDYDGYGYPDEPDPYEESGRANGRPAAAGGPGTPPKPLYAPKTDVPVYEAGMKVEHKKFGQGIIVSVSEDGMRLHVNFAGRGLLELDARYAPITVI